MPSPTTHTTAHRMSKDGASTTINNNMRPKGQQSSSSCVTFTNHAAVITPLSTLKYQPAHKYCYATFIVNDAVKISKHVARTLEFWSRVSNIYMSYKATQLSVGIQSKFRSSQWTKHQWDKRHAAAADMMLDLCTSMKGFYVKAGQFIALQSFVPSIIRDKLGALLDDMKPMSSTKAEKLVKKELKAFNLNEVFEPLNFETSVLGSASIAQVNKARLRKEIQTKYKVKYDEVVLKVKHESTKERMMIDLSNFETLGNILERTDLKVDLKNPIRELKSQISKEFDFIHEVNALMKIRKSLKHINGIIIPNVVQQLSTNDLLTMQYVNGVPLSKLSIQKDKKVTRYVGKKILSHLSKAYAKMILVDGYFHADCHPGNIIIVNKNIDIGLIDFGQVKQLTEDQRIGFVRLVHAMAHRDSKSIESGMEALGIRLKLHDDTRHANKNELSVHEKIAYTMFDTATVKGVSDNPFSSESALREAKISNLPKDLMLLLRTTQILKGICRATYNDDFSIINAWRNVAEQQLNKAHH